MSSCNMRQLHTLYQCPIEFERLELHPVPQKAFSSADCYTIYTTYLSLSTQSAGANAFRGTTCILFSYFSDYTFKKTKYLKFKKKKIPTYF